MSKAFTREDDLPEAGPPKRLPSVFPPGAMNYLTPDGAKRLRAELDTLLDSKLPAPAAGPMEDAARARRQAVAERIHELRRILDSAVILAPPADDLDVVRFGATVSVRHLADGGTMRYRIV